MNRTLAYVVLTVNIFIPVIILGAVGICLWGFWPNWIVILVCAAAIYSLCKDAPPFEDGWMFAAWNPRYWKKWLASWDEMQSGDSRANDVPAGNRVRRGTEQP